MGSSNWSDKVVGFAGSVAGSMVDPRQGLATLRSARPARTGAMVTVALVAGYLFARSRRRG